MADTPTQCDHCGAVDTHPKSHWNSGKSYHLDCLPFDLKKEFLETAPHMEAVVEAALRGIHGDDLKAVNDEVHANLARAGESE